MSSDPTPSFEDALADLERIVRDLEEGQLSLEDSLARYERGIRLLKCCHGLLRNAEERIRVLTGVDETGRPITTQFDPAAAEREAKAASAAEPPAPGRRSASEPRASSAPLWPEP